MQKLSPEEAKDIIPATNGRETLVSAMIKSLKVGEALIITRADWKSKYPPSTIANAISKKYGRKFTKGRLADKPGWFIRREE